jgi:hypothetical protein
MAAPALALLLPLTLQLTASASAPGHHCNFTLGVDLRCSDYASEVCTELGHVHVKNDAGCCAACAAKRDCTAAVLLTTTSEKGDCFLKKLAEGTQLSSHRAGAIGCVLTSSGPPAPPAPPPGPPPFFPFRNTSLLIAERVANLVSLLTLEEKILQMTRGGAKANTPAPAIERLGLLPHIWGTECATGLGSDDGSFAGTSFPQPLGQAATWDKALIHAVANATAVEIRAQHNEDMKNHVVQYHHGLNCWSPVINIMRHWAWGRNDETYGECPVLSGAFAKQFVDGLQGADERYVAATAGCKHFVVHGGPDTLRQTMSANVSLRDWATTFLPQFESCVEAGGLGMMCSFNSIRGVPAVSVTTLLLLLSTPAPPAARAAPAQDCADTALLHAAVREPQGDENVGERAVELLGLHRLRPGRGDGHSH